MCEAKVDPEYVYAFERTGLLLAEENRHLMPTKDVEEFEAEMAVCVVAHGGESDSEMDRHAGEPLSTWTTEAPKPTACCRRSSTCISSAPK